MRTILSVLDRHAEVILGKVDHSGFAAFRGEPSLTEPLKFDTITT